MSVQVVSGWRRFLPVLGQNDKAAMDARTLYALASLLLLVQLPHLAHLPLWISFLGAALVGGRLMLLWQPEHKLLKYALSPLSITCIAAATATIIKWDFGYFIGRDPSVAFLFVLVAAKYAEVRRPSDATLLLCLAAFLLLTQYFYSQSVISALVTLPAVVALAYSLAILRDPENPAKLASQLRLIFTLLLQGLPLAALLFIVFPRLPGPLWSLPEDAVATTGLSDSMSPGSIGDLSKSDAVAFRVEFESDIPAVNERYWRGPVLSEFDGRNWRVNSKQFESVTQYNGPVENLLSYSVMLQPHRQRWLFALDTAVGRPQPDKAATQLRPADGRSLARMFSDGQILAHKPVAQVLRYHQQSLLSDSFSPVHHPADNNLVLPGKNSRTIQFAQQLRQRSPSDMAFAQTVMHHFNEQEFFYTLQPKLLGDTPVDEFMFDTRSGFCEHYAAAFVVMMRAAGIPSRVVTGYLGGEMNEGYMIVRQSDAHAWTESFIDGRWRRFDPTGAVAPSRVEQGLSAALPNDSAVPRLARLDAGWIKDMQLRWDAINHNWQRLVIDFDNSSQDKLWEKLGLGKPQLWQIMLIVLIIAGIWSIVVLGMPGFATSRLSVQERYWQRLCRFLNKRGLTRQNNESPKEYLARASHVWPQQEERFARIHDAFDNLRFRQLDNTQRVILQRALWKDFVSLILILRPLQKTGSSLISK